MLISYRNGKAKTWSRTNPIDYPRLILQWTPRSPQPLLSPRWGETGPSAWHCQAVLLPSEFSYHPPQLLQQHAYTSRSAESHDLRTALAGQIARALSVFCVDEVIVFSDGDTKQQQSQQHTPGQRPPVQQDLDPLYTGITNPVDFLVHLLSFLETPPHLRRYLFPLHPNLRTAGLLPSLDLPHHLPSGEWCPYREGVSLPQSSPAEAANATLVEAGFRVPVTVKADIPAFMRVTLRFSNAAGVAARDPATRKIRAEAVDPAAPRKEAGYYWGYTVRGAHCLSAVYEDCPFDGGYDVSIGTSERGRPLRDAEADLGIAPFRHLLLVLGGVAGLEEALAHDAKLKSRGVVGVADLFEFWVNILPGQGSRTIRTEEALWIALMGIQGAVAQNATGEGGEARNGTEVGVKKWQDLFLGAVAQDAAKVREEEQNGTERGDEEWEDLVWW